MCEVRFREKRPRTKKKSTVISSKKKWTEMNPIRRRMKKPIQWTERPTGALVAAGSLWPRWTTSGLLNITDWSWSWSGRTLVSFICGRCCFCHFKPFSHQFHTGVSSFCLVHGRYKPGIGIRLVLSQVIPNWYVLLYQYSSYQ